MEYKTVNKDGGVKYAFDTEKKAYVMKATFSNAGSVEVVELFVIPYGLDVTNLINHIAVDPRFEGLKLTSLITVEMKVTLFTENK